ncbi:hypothetical protein X474_20045 [Dethiosulfatarculus sandiegensis]|uniref:Uncharacterized protein n=1 Tax=Dethiosulfatarculus sandiegensis TaxID=1429043 RepID=A0A0D2HP17_9BACT|nr:hypothetical protein X474_20045 [Dethiosulfatarculus sandiegensis]
MEVDQKKPLNSLYQGPAKGKFASSLGPAS